MIARNPPYYHEVSIAYNSNFDYKGNWYNGIWYRGIWLDGIWHYGKWSDGYLSPFGLVSNSGIWLKGYWKQGEILTISLKYEFLIKPSPISPKSFRRPKLTISLNYAKYC